MLLRPPVPESAEASVTSLPLVSKVAPLLPKAASLDEMSVVVPEDHCRPPPLRVIAAEPKLFEALMLIRPPVTVVHTAYVTAAIDVIAPPPVLARLVQP